MPFTLSHVAAALPFLDGARARGPLVASALVAGSMAPDVPFFADSLLPGVYHQGDLTHQWWAVPTVDVALAAALVAGWHGLLRGPLVALLPDRWARAVESVTAPGPDRPDLARAGWFAASAALGAATHVGWDAFTHGGRFGAVLPVLNVRVVGGLPLYTVLQYSSSAVALGLLARYAVREARRAEPGVPVRRPPAVLRRAGVVLLVAATVAGVAYRLADTERQLVAEFCFGAGAGLTVGAAGYAAAARLWQRRGRRPGPGYPAPDGAGERTPVQARRASA
ncbi:DUF4184 family protein [Kitasatospora sp. NBC_00240]|uniref:DUF4184 family protein n=1 Tax=Kitasatospora sp. NBC_00240 TaxID=2903567 RepID=UPI0022518DD2|nr:DUF4184 family protein [Kitasatospora sp. NBC_00240]MCX5213974.1 DUF4184 family protein [Kitasatospora sp. NBC_00240]